MTDAGPDSDADADPAADPPALVLPIARGKGWASLGGVALFVGACAAIWFTSAADRTSSGFVPNRVLLAASAAVFATAFGFGLVRLVRGAPALVVDRVGFHQGRRTIRWEHAIAATISDLPVAHSIRQLSIVPATGKPIRINDRQVDRPVDVQLARIEDWAERHLPAGAGRPLWVRPSAPDGGAATRFSNLHFPRAAAGYDPDQVDRFMIELGTWVDALQDRWRAAEAQATAQESALAAATGNHETLAGPAEPPPAAPAAETLLAGVRFGEASGGYDPEEVTRFLRAAGAKIAELQDLERRARERADRAEARRVEEERGGSVV